MNNTEPQSTRGEVLVVGAGPVGLSAALALHARGRPVTILEAEPEDRIRPGSRAIFVHRASLQLLEQMCPGLGRDIATRGLVWPTKRTFWRGREVFVRHYPPPKPDALPPFTSLPQVEIERFLLDACHAVGITFAWDAPVTGVETTPEGVRRWLPKVMFPRYAERVTWVSTYQFMQVVAKDFTDQHYRVLLAGEAAHLFAPFGARGMNSGIADAVAAAAAIDNALNMTNRSEAREAVEEFARTRRAAAEYNRMAAGQALAHIQTRSPVMQARRNLAALLAPYWKRAGAWLDEGPYGPRSGPPGQAGGRY